MKKSSSSAEPSMEEILASIRQIIEQGDAGRDNSSAAQEKARPEVTQEAQAPTPIRQAPVFSSPVYVTPVRPSYSGALAFDLRQDADESEPESAATMLDEAVGDIVDAVEALDSTKADEVAVQDIEAVLAAEFAAEHEPVAQEQFVPPAAEATMESAVPDSNSAPAGTLAANNDEPRMRDFRNAVLEEVAGQSEPGFRYEPLISDETELQISASFAELTQAIRSGELRSLEEMAQDILRPMMKEWLDENLPDVVAEIVREEIRRAVLRGR